MSAKKQDEPIDAQFNDTSQLSSGNLGLMIVAQNTGLDLYAGIASAPFTDAETKILLADVKESDVEIRPDGLIYLPEIKYRARLNKAFGPGAWALACAGMKSDGENVVYDGILYIHGRYVARALGGAEFIPNNPNYSMADAAESAKSVSLRRCCKDIGIGAELWDPQYVSKWLTDNAVQVWVEGAEKSNVAGKRKKEWRKKNANPIDRWPWHESPGTGNAGNKGKKQDSPRNQAPTSELPTEPALPETHLLDKLAMTFEAVKDEIDLRQTLAEFGRENKIEGPITKYGQIPVLLREAALDYIAETVRIAREEKEKQSTAKGLSEDELEEWIGLGGLQGAARSRSIKPEPEPAHWTESDRPQSAFVNALIRNLDALVEKKCVVTKGEGFELLNAILSGGNFDKVSDVGELGDRAAKYAVAKVSNLGSLSPAKAKAEIARLIKG